MGEWGLGLVNIACRKVINITCYGGEEEKTGIQMACYYQPGGLLYSHTRPACAISVPFHPMNPYDAFVIETWPLSLV